MLQTDTKRQGEDDLALDLPSLGDDDGVDDGMDDAGDLEVEAAEDEGDPFDDAVADDIPLDPMITTTAEEPTAVGDDAVGLDHLPAADGINLEEGGHSLIGSDDDGPERDGDEDLGVDGDAGEDDGGAEGVIDPADERVDELPPLDGQENDDGPPRAEDGDALEIPSRDESGLDLDVSAAAALSSDFHA